MAHSWQIYKEDDRTVKACMMLINTGKMSYPESVEIRIHYNNIDSFKDGIRNLNIDDEEKSNFESELICRAKQKILPLTKFDWLKKNPRACYWVLGMLVIYPSFPNTDSFYLTPQNNARIHYSTPQNSALQNLANSHSDRFIQLVDFFDSSSMDLNQQQNSLTELQQSWSEIYNSQKKIMSWLDPKNEEQCNWARDYFHNYGYQQGLTNFPPISYFTPTTLEEKYLSIFAAYDLWQTTFEAKTLFLQNLNKAWQQKKHRDGLKGKKACNFYISEEAKNKLDTMAKIRNMKLNKFIETLIEEEFERRKQTNK